MRERKREFCLLRLCHACTEIEYVSVTKNLHYKVGICGNISIVYNSDIFGNFYCTAYFSLFYVSCTKNSKYLVGTGENIVMVHNLNTSGNFFCTVYFFSLSVSGIHLFSYYFYVQYLSSIHSLTVQLLLYYYYYYFDSLKVQLSRDCGSGSVYSVSLNRDTLKFLNLQAQDLDCGSGSDYIDFFIPRLCYFLFIFFIFSSYIDFRRTAATILTFLPLTR